MRPRPVKNIITATIPKSGCPEKEKIASTIPPPWKERQNSVKILPQTRCRNAHILVWNGKDGKATSKSMCAKALCGATEGTLSSNRRKERRICSRSLSMLKPHEVHTGFAHKGTKCRRLTSNCTFKRLCSSKKAATLKEANLPTNCKSSEVACVDGKSIDKDCAAAISLATKSSERQGKWTFASAESSQARKTDTSAVTTAPPHLFARMSANSMPCHMLAPAVSPLLAAATITVEAAAAIVLVTLRADTATLVVASPKSATAPMTRATWNTGPCCPEHTATKNKRDRPDRPFRHHGTSLQHLLSKDGLRRPPHWKELATALPLACACEGSSFATEPEVGVINVCRCSSLHCLFWCGV